MRGVSAMVVLAAALLTLGLPCMAAYWNVDLVYAGGFASEGVALAVNGESITSISYTAGGTLNLATKTLLSWDSEPIAEVGFWGGLSSLAFDADGRPCVAFVDTSQIWEDPLLKFAYRQSGQWFTETVDEVGWPPEYVSLGLMPDGIVCIAYSKTTGDYPEIQSSLRFAKRTGSNSWTSEQVMALGNATGPAMCAAGDGSVFVACADSASGQLKLAAKMGGGVWQIHGIDGGESSPVTPYAAMALRPDGRPAIAYYRIHEGMVELRYAEELAGSWRSETAATFTGFGPHYCSTAVTPEGIPFIAYYDGEAESFRNAWRSGGRWLVETVDSAQQVGVSPSLKLDGIGNLCAAYFDRWEGNVKFASAVAPMPAKAVKALPDGVTVQMSGVVASSAQNELGSRIYVQEADRSCGIQLLFTGELPPVTRGMLLDVQGETTTVMGERAIIDPEMTQLGEMPAPKALGMKNAALGGGDLHYSPGPSATGQQGIEHAHGLNNIGLLIRSWGRVTEIGAGCFKIDDGSAVPVKCSIPGIDPPELDGFVVVTGISSCEQDDDRLHRLIRVRSIHDVVASAP